MSKLLVIVGFGPGTATAVADRFGSEGFTVALLGRSQERLNAGVSALRAKGIEACAFPANVAEPASLLAAMNEARAQMGPIGVLFWNLFGGIEAGDLLAADPAVVRAIFDAPVLGLIAAVTEVMPDLKNGGAILVSNGGLAEDSAESDKAAVAVRMMGLALASAAKNKLAGLLAERLRDEGVFVGEVVVHGTIKGTQGSVDGAIESSTIADKHWELYLARRENRASVFPPFNARPDW